MRYNLTDFLIDFSYNLKLETIDQPLTVMKLEQREAIALERISPFVQALLKTNDITRVDADNHYKIHKSYPSPRSIYNIDLAIKSNGMMVTKNTFNDNYYRVQLDDERLEEGDIILTCAKPYPTMYKKIHKTLFLLESGHLLYNLLFVAARFGQTYTIRSERDYVVLKRQATDEPSELKATLTSFLLFAERRTSGSFTKIDLPFATTKQPFATLDQADERMIEQQFGLSRLQDIVEMTICENRDGTYINERRGVSFSYQTMNEIYPFMNFKEMDAITLFSLKNEALHVKELSSFILLLGYLAQLFTHRNFTAHAIHRPVKSFDRQLLRQQLKIDEATHTPMYMLLSKL